MACGVSVASLRRGRLRLAQSYGLHLLAEVTSAWQCSNKFDIALAYPYLWLRRRYCASEKCKRACFCPRLFVSLASPKILRLGRTKLTLASALDFSYLCFHGKSIFVWIGAAVDRHGMPRTTADANGLYDNRNPGRYDRYRSLLSVAAGAACRRTGQPHLRGRDAEFLLTSRTRNRDGRTRNNFG